MTNRKAGTGTTVKTVGAVDEPKGKSNREGTL
jgi:hypothetical protein